MLMLPRILLPNPPPVYSQIRTTFEGSMPTASATLGAVRPVLWVEG